MRILEFWLLFSFSFCCPVLAADDAAHAASEKPNILFIIADDLGWADVAFHGGNVPTPNLDKLAAENLELTQHYVAPMCSPTRTGLLTGRYWSRFGVTSATNDRVMPFDTVTLPRALGAAGYETCLTGKWHLGSLPEWGPNRYGFDYSYGSLAGGVNSYHHRYKKGPYSLTWHRNETRIEEDGHVTELITAEAIDWLKQRGERPFFLYVPFTAVHLPVSEPDEWLDRVPQHIADGVPRQYAACIMHFDDAVGRILAALDATGKRDNTLVVVTSDNGGSTAENNDTRYPLGTYPAGRLTGNNTPLRGEKGSLYEGGIRVPTVVSWPGKIAPGKCTMPVHIVDWMPTLCSIAKAEPSGDLRWDGTNVWSHLTKEAPEVERTLYWAGRGFKTSVLRRGDWKLHVQRGRKTEQVELFDLAKDPNETTNLAGQFSEQVAELKSLLVAAARSDHDAALEKTPQSVR